MAISNMQQPRQMYGLGSFVKKIGKGIKGAVKSVAKIAKSPLGIAALGLGINQFGIPFTGGKGAGFLGNLMGKAGGMNMSTKLGLGTAFATYLGSKGFQQEEVESITRDKDKLSIYLKDYFTKLNPNASDEEIEAFVTTNTSEYAVGGRVGFANGKNMKMASMDENEKELMRLVEEFMEQGFSQQEAIEEAKDTLERKSIAIGGRVGLESGTPKKGLESLTKEDLKKFRITLPNIIEYDKDGNRIEREIPRIKGPYKYDPDREIPRRLLRNKSAFGGRIGLEAGANKDFQEYLKGREEFNKKQNAEQL